MKNCLRQAGNNPLRRLHLPSRVLPTRIFPDTFPCFIYIFFMPPCDAIVLSKNNMQLNGRTILRYLLLMVTAGMPILVKDTLVYQAQLPLNTLSEPPLVNSRVAVGIIEKRMPAGLQARGDMPTSRWKGMMPPPADREEGMHIFEDSIIWYKFLL